MLGCVCVCMCVCEYISCETCIYKHTRAHTRTISGCAHYDATRTARLPHYPITPYPISGYSGYVSSIVNIPT